MMNHQMFSIRVVQQGYCSDVGFYVVVRSVEEEQGEAILLLLRDPRVDPNQQVFFSSSKPAGVGGDNDIALYGHLQ